MRFIKVFNISRDGITSGLVIKESIGALNYPQGIPTSLHDSGQQWDFPNAWPPLMHMTIHAFSQSKYNPVMREDAYQAAAKWVASNYKTWRYTKAMYEKYTVNATSASSAGGGGEYVVQKGFGWTNGVILDLLYTYGSRLEAPVISHATKNPDNNILFMLAIIMSLLWNYC